MFHMNVLELTLQLLYLLMVRTLLLTPLSRTRQQVMLQLQHLLRHTLLNIVLLLDQVHHYLQVLKDQLQGQVLHFLSSLVYTIFVVSLLII